MYQSSTETHRREYRTDKSQTPSGDGRFTAERMNIMETRRFAVYTRIATAKNEEQRFTDVLIMNVEALSNGGAEHKLLDKFATVTNALAFDMETEAAQMLPYLTKSKVFDIKDFETRNRRREAAIQESIDEQLDSINEVRVENMAHHREILRLKSEIARHEAEIEDNVKWIEAWEEELDEFCNFYGLPPIHSEEELIMGIA